MARVPKGVTHVDSSSLILRNRQDKADERHIFE